MLEDRRREILNEVQSKIKDVRSEGTASLNTGVVDAEETSVSDIQEDIELALIQMKAETLTRVNEALERLNAGPTGAATSAATKSARSACARCRSRSAARTAKRRARSRCSASVRCRSAGAPRPSSSTCQADGTSCMMQASPGLPSARHIARAGEYAGREPVLPRRPPVSHFRRIAT